MTVNLLNTTTNKGMAMFYAICAIYIYAIYVFFSTQHLVLFLGGTYNFFDIRYFYTFLIWACLFVRSLVQDVTTYMETIMRNPIC